MADDPHYAYLAETDVGIANFDLHTNERKVHIGPGAAETSLKPDRLLMGGLT